MKIFSPALNDTFNPCYLSQYNRHTWTRGPSLSHFDLLNPVYACGSVEAGVCLTLVDICLAVLSREPRLAHTGVTVDLILKNLSA